jgi:hypothetical protein
MDDGLLHAMIRRLFDMKRDERLHVLPVTNLEDAQVRARLVADVNDPSAPRQFITFQQLFGGEIGLPRSPASPEFSFDATVVEVAPGLTETGGATIRLGRYGVIEMQTTDTHGSYRYAVKALRDALDLHSSEFGVQLASHPDWPGRKVEGPNISNVFKRTFYQIMFKFQITRRESSAGCVLALPRPVWDSWQPFLGAPTLIDVGDGTHRLGSSTADQPACDPPRNWIYVFDIAEAPPGDGGSTPINIDLVIATDASTLSKLALDLAPAHAIGNSLDSDTVMLALRRRIGTFVSEIE